jgi:hypothetical protein
MFDVHFFGLPHSPFRIPHANFHIHLIAHTLKIPHSLRGAGHSRQAKVTKSFDIA